MVVPIIIGGLLAVGGWLAGKSGSGGGIEIGTSKKSEQVTNTSQDSYSSVYSPTITKTFDLSRNYAFGQSSISTKKEQSITQEPETSVSQIPSQAVSPTANLGGGGSAKESFDFTGLALVGALGLGTYILFFGEDKK